MIVKLVLINVKLLVMVKWMLIVLVMLFVVSLIYVIVLLWLLMVVLLILMMVRLVGGEILVLLFDCLLRLTRQELCFDFVSEVSLVVGLIAALDAQLAHLTVGVHLLGHQASLFRSLIVALKVVLVILKYVWWREMATILR